MRAKPDQENVDEAHRAAFRAYPFAQVPAEIVQLLASSHLASLTADAPVFDRLLGALRAFVDTHGALPLSAALPDMHADTASYVRLQTLYKARADAEKVEFTALVVGDVDPALVDAFVKNAHALRVLSGRRFGALDADPDAVANALAGAAYPREPITHFALSAFAALGSTKPTLPALRAAFDALVGSAGAELPEKDVTDCLGEMCVLVRHSLFVLTGAQRARADGRAPQRRRVPRWARRAGGHQAHHEAVRARGRVLHRRPRLHVHGRRAVMDTPIVEGAPQGIDISLLLVLRGALCVCTYGASAPSFSHALLTRAVGSDVIHVHWIG